MAKLRLLKRHAGKNPGDTINVSRQTEINVLKALKIAEDYVEPEPQTARRTATRVMKPEELPAAEQAQPASEESTLEENSNAGRRYGRRDMQPEE